MWDIDQRFTFHLVPMVLKEEISRTLPALVEHLHSLGVVHGDLRPANVVLTPTNQIILIDFGLSTENNGYLASIGLLLSDNSQWISIHLPSPEQENYNLKLICWSIHDPPTAIRPEDELVFGEWNVIE